MRKWGRNRGRGRGRGRWGEEGGIPMVVSGGDDAQLLAFSGDSFMAFLPHHFCPSPQLPPMQLANGEVPAGHPLLLVQHPGHLDLWRVAPGGGKLAGSHGKGGAANGHMGNGVSSSAVSNSAVSNSGVENGTPTKKKRKSSLKEKPLANGAVGGSVLGSSGGVLEEEKKVPEGSEPLLVARIKSSSSEHLSCSAISSNGALLAFSDSWHLRLFQLARGDGGERGALSLAKQKLPPGVPSAHQLAFSVDSQRLYIAAREGGIMVLFPTHSGLSPSCLLLFSFS